jgi:hypothetical protein
MVSKMKKLHQICTIKETMMHAGIALFKVLFVKNEFKLFEGTTTNFVFMFFSRSRLAPSIPGLVGISAKLFRGTPVDFSTKKNRTFLS